MGITITMEARGSVNGGPLDRTKTEDLLVEIELNISTYERNLTAKGKPIGFNGLMSVLRNPYDATYPYNEDFMAGKHEYTLYIVDHMAIELAERTKGIDLSRAPLLGEIIDACRVVQDFQIFVERNTRAMLPYRANT